jgi:UDP-glucose 4-epimerase
MALDFMAKGGESQIMNCGYGRGFTVKEVIDMVKEKSGCDFAVEETERRPGDPDALTADNSKITAVMGWKPDHDDLGVIVRSALDWEREWQSRRESN